MDELDFIELVSSKWPELLSRGISEKPDGKGRIVALACTITGINILMGISLGPRRGVKESVFAFDPRKKIIADQLIVSRCSDLFGWLVDLSKLRADLRTAADPVSVCRCYLEDGLRRVRANPEPYLESLRGLGHEPSYDRPSFVFSGGGWGLGKRK